MTERRRPGIEWQVAGADAGMRLDAFLAAEGRAGSRGRATRAITRGQVFLNDDEATTADAGQRLAPRDRVRLWLDRPGSATRRSSARSVGPLEILYEDAALLVINKPAGLLSVPLPRKAEEPAVTDYLERHLRSRGKQQPQVVHRIDRDTSGLLVVARSEEAYAKLQELVRERELERRYKALVRGRPRSWTGRIEAPIGRDRHDPTRHSLDTDTPREAITHFEVERLLDRHALLDVRLETGRTHQIRAHLLAIGHPIAGDPDYGAAGRYGLERQFLHAARLAFAHPATGEPVDVRSPLPADLAAALARAEGGPDPRR